MCPFHHLVRTLWQHKRLVNLPKLFLWLHNIIGARCRRMSTLQTIPVIWYDSIFCFDLVLPNSHYLDLSLRFFNLKCFEIIYLSSNRLFAIFILVKLVIKRPESKQKIIKEGFNYCFIFFAILMRTFSYLYSNLSLCVFFNVFRHL